MNLRPLPRLYAILDAGCFPHALGLLAAAAELASAGVNLIQYRNKSGNARQMLETARELKKRLFDIERRDPHASQKMPDMGRPSVENSIRLIMNDRADLALAAEFDGVHVGQDDLSPESVRKLIGAERWLGVSTHNPEQLREADLTMVGMMLMTAAISAPLVYSQKRFFNVNRHLAAFSGFASMAFGIFLVYHIGFIDGLFTSQVHWIPQ